MPMQMNVGINKKVGLPDFGSFGAQCHLEVELDHSLLENRVALKKQMEAIYELCRESVEGQLRQHGGTNGTASQEVHGKEPGTNGHGLAKNRIQNAFGNGHGRNAPISEKQRRYIDRLIQRQSGWSPEQLEEICRDQWQKPVALLTSSEASQLIDQIKQGNPPMPEGGPR